MRNQRVEPPSYYYGVPRDNAFHPQIRLGTLGENTASDGFCTKRFGSAMRPPRLRRVFGFWIRPRITRITPKADRRVPEVCRAEALREGGSFANPCFSSHPIRNSNNIVTKGRWRSHSSHQR